MKGNISPISKTLRRLALTAVLIATPLTLSVAPAAAEPPSEPPQNFGPATILFNSDGTIKKILQPGHFAYGLACNF